MTSKQNVESMRKAGFWIRAAAYLLDSLILYIPILLIQDLIDSHYQVGQQRQLLYFITALTIWWIYTVGLNASAWQGTCGKKILKLKVVNKNGERISLLRANIRFFAEFISAVIFALGFFLAAWNKKKRALHDFIAGTFVIREPLKKTKVAILISGRGSNMQAIVNACENPDFPAEVVMVFSNKKDAAGLEFARKKNIPTAFIDHKNFLSREEFDKKMSEEIEKSGAQLICLAGFMRLLSPWFVQHWFDRLINIHPSLLPEFKGADAVGDAIKAGAKKSGCTVHFVREEMDSGPIIKQAFVKVLKDDTKETLAAKILKEEHKIYPKSLKIICKGHL